MAAHAWQEVLDLSTQPWARCNGEAPRSKHGSSGIVRGGINGGVPHRQSTNFDKRGVATKPTAWDLEIRARVACHTMANGLASVPAAALAFGVSM